MADQQTTNTAPPEEGPPLEQQAAGAEPLQPAGPDLDPLLSRVAQQITAQRLPVATYRLQFHSGLTFRQVQELVPYLATLGVSDIYASPLLQACEGSQSGYDVADCSAIGSELGTPDELESLSAALHARQMGLILDIVPNHMGTRSARNRWWMDVLENGPSSPFAGYFDIDWMPLKPDLADKVLLPVLGDQFGKVLEDGQLTLHFEDGAFWLHYYDARFPITPGAYALILADAAEPLRQQLGDEHPDLLEYLSILTAIRNLPPYTETDSQRIAERQREKEIIKQRLKHLVDRSPEVAASLEENLRQLNGSRGNPRSFDRLDELLSQQPYRLSYWRVAADEINYRRFFDVNELAAICVEHREVFEATHALILDLLDRGLASGLRIDHPDGLYDPRAYLWQLQEARFLQLCRREWNAQLPATDSASAGVDVSEGNGAPSNQPAEEGGDLWPALRPRLVEAFRHKAGELAGYPLYVVVEKILGPNEHLPEDWPVHGTVGYEFLNRLNGIFLERANEKAVSTVYERFTDEALDFRELAYQCKLLIVRTSMGSELTVLGHRLDRISERNRWSRDFTRTSLTRALQEIIACFGVYRTYVAELQMRDEDRRYVEVAAARAKRRNPAMSASIFDFVRDLLLLRVRENADEEERQAQLRLIGKFQQLTGSIMAKAVEDTAFYRYNRLVSLNEVGGEPERFGNDVAAFHELNQQRLPRLARGLSSTSTHDTKRSEDVRARINVLSEIPREWRQHLTRWGRWNRRFRAEVEGQLAPSLNDEYLLYQTLIGIWPDEVPAGEARAKFLARVQQYMLKVAREAKLHSSWISPNEQYEDALTRFVERIFADDNRRSFLASLDSFAQAVAEHGRWNSLSQTLLKIASPGVPDFYQGTELWNLTLVDPDNRGPVDFEHRQRLLSELMQELSKSDPESRSLLLRDLIDCRRDGRIKLYTTLLGLELRRRASALFTEGEYVPLRAQGQHAEHVVALARRRGDQLAIAVAPRLTARLCGLGGPPPVGALWGDTAVVLPADFPPGTVVNGFDGQSHALGEAPLPVSRLLAEFPVALCSN